MGVDSALPPGLLKYVRLLRFMKRVTFCFEGGCHKGFLTEWFFNSEAKNREQLLDVLQRSGWKDEPEQPEQATKRSDHKKNRNRERRRNR